MKRETNFVLVQSERNQSFNIDYFDNRLLFKFNLTEWKQKVP